MAVGTSGNQYKNGPVVGQMMAELIEACKKGHDHDRDPVTLTGKYTGAILDLGFYSRLREINKDSSFSVLG
jgi:sarcosine oxidase subunit beta